MRTRLGNLISDFRFHSWRLREPFCDPGWRAISDDRCLHPRWFDRVLVRVQYWLWRDA
ncbi:MAG: hypothetical protein ACXVGB_00105 [Mycobacteriaceae bacterium]